MKHPRESTATDAQRSFFSEGVDAVRWTGGSIDPRADLRHVRDFYNGRPIDGIVNLDITG